MITTTLNGYRINYRYIDTWGTPCSDSKNCDTMLEVAEFIEGLKERHGDKIRAVYLETYEEIVI